MTEKRFTVHIRWYNYEKTEGEIELKDNGQPLLISESIDDVRYIKNLLNELHEENQDLKTGTYTNVKNTLKELKEISDYQAMRIKELTEENERLSKDRQLAENRSNANKTNTKRINRNRTNTHRTECPKTIQTNNNGVNNYE